MDSVKTWHDGDEQFLTRSGSSNFQHLERKDGRYEQSLGPWGLSYLGHGRCDHLRTFVWHLRVSEFDSPVVTSLQSNCAPLGDPFIRAGGARNDASQF